MLTGDISSGKGDLKALAAKAGLRVTGAVSRKAALLVAADPYSQSGKAQAARQLGVRIVTEQVFRYYTEQVFRYYLEEVLAGGSGSGSGSG